MIFANRVFKSIIQIPTRITKSISIIGLNIIFNLNLSITTKNRI